MCLRRVLAPDDNTFTLSGIRTMSKLSEYVTHSSQIHDATRPLAMLHAFEQIGAAKPSHEHTAKGIVPTVN